MCVKFVKEVKSLKPVCSICAEQAVCTGRAKKSNPLRKISGIVADFFTKFTMFTGHILQILLK